MMLSYARLESLKKELSSVNKGTHVPGKRSRQAEVSLTDLRIPLAWRHSEQNLSDKSKFAIFCTITSGTQIFDTSVKIVDSSCADIAFSESFVFSNMSPDFDVKIEVFSHRMKGTSSKNGGLKNWFQNIQKRVGSKSKFLKNRKAINFKTLTVKHLFLEDCSNVVESYDLENSPNVSSSSCSSSKSSSSSSSPTSVVSVGRSLQLFGLLCCRLSASPYSRSEAVRSGKVAISLVETGDLVKDCFIRLGDWKLEIWTSTSQFRRGEIPWKIVKLGTGSLVRQEVDRFCVENEDEDHADIICDNKEDANGWVEDILDHIEDVSKWGKVSSCPLEMFSPEPNKSVTMRRLRQTKTASKIMLFYNRISSGDLMERNLLRNERIIS